MAKRTRQLLAARLRVCDLPHRPRLQRHNDGVRIQAAKIFGRGNTYDLNNRHPSMDKVNREIRCPGYVVSDAAQHRLALRILLSGHGGYVASSMA